MATHKYIDRICIAVTAFTLLLTILFMNGKAIGISTLTDQDAAGDLFTANDLNADWDASDATQIILSDEKSAVKGNGAYVYDGNVHIVYAGKYILSGELTDGNIVIEADSDDKIWLMLNGVSIHCEEDAAVRIEQADKVFLTLAEGTENKISSGQAYKEEAVSAGIDGAIYSRDDLTINGRGTLQVTAEYQHGIVGNDDVVITGGTITIEAVQDGIHAHDNVRIREADISISAGDDGITVSNDEESASLYIESGSIDISACYEGLEAIDVTIAGGTISILSEDDGINANGSGENSVIRITGGDITIINKNGRDADGLDSNKDIDISGGTVFISVSNDGSSSAIDYGSENGGICTISGGTVLACGSSGMAEGFDSSSSQGFLMYNTSAVAGTTVTLEDANGKTLLSEEIPCSFSSVVVSTPEMAIGDTCTITVGEVSEELVIDNSSNTASWFGGGRMPGRGNMPDEGKMFGGGNIPDESEMPDGDKMFGRGNMPDESEMPDGDKIFGGDEMPDGDKMFGGDEMPDRGKMFDGGNMPDENETLDGDKIPVGGEVLGGGEMEIPNERMQRNPNADRMSDGEELNRRTDNGEGILLLGISAGVLLLGCAIAFCFKQRT